MDDFLNLVYEDYIDENPSPNGYNTIGKNEVRLSDNFFYFYGINNIKRYRLNEIEKFGNKIFILPINYIRSLGEYLPIDKMISSGVIEYLKKNSNLKILLINEHEPEGVNVVIKLISSIRDLKLDESKFYLLNNNALLNEYNEKLKTKINFHTLNTLSLLTSQAIVNFTPEYLENKNGKFFLCHNRNPKPHRYGILSLLKNKNILQYCDWSIVSQSLSKRIDINKKLFMSSIFEDSDLIKYHDDIEFFYNHPYKESEYEINNGWFNGGYFEWNKIYNIKSFENTYVNIVTESEYFDQSVHITEKSLKPFFFYQLPIIIGSHRHIEKIREIFGFDFFDDIIDHNYDKEINPHKRIKLIFEEIIKLNRKKDYIIDFYKKNKERFVENHQKVLKLKYDKKDYNFFKNFMI